MKTIKFAIIAHNAIDKIVEDYLNTLPQELKEYMLDNHKSCYFICPNIVSKDDSECDELLISKDELGLPTHISIDVNNNMIYHIHVQYEFL